MLDVDDSTPVYSQKDRWVEYLFYGGQTFQNNFHVTESVEVGIIAVSGDIGDVGDINKQFSVGGSQRQSFFKTTFQRPFLVLLACFGDGHCQFVSVDRFEQIVHSIQFDGIHEIFPVIVCRSEDDVWQGDGLPHFIEQLYGIPSLQLYVQEQQVGLTPQYAAQGTVVIVATVYHFHLLAEVLKFLQE